MTTPSMLTTPELFDLEAEQVGLQDTRVLVPDTTQPPFRYICHLRSRMPNGQFRVGTGTLIGSRTVLTAAHNLVGRDCTAIVVTPARSGGTAPFGSTRGSSSLLWFPTFDRARDGGTARDIGLLRLQAPIGRRSGVWTLAHSRSSVDPIGRSIDGRLPQAAGVLRVNLSGYPGDKCGTPTSPPPCGTTQWRTYNATVRATRELLQYVNDTKRGHSGSPVWVRRDPTRGGRVLVAVHVGRGPLISPGRAAHNKAVRLTPALIAWIRQHAR
jgi:glutamyl endopeptidase